MLLGAARPPPLIFRRHPRREAIKPVRIHVNALNEQLGIDWLNSRIVTGMFDEVRFGPIGATLLGDY